MNKRTKMIVAVLVITILWSLVLESNSNKMPRRCNVFLKGLW